MVDEEGLSAKYKLLRRFLDERSWRLCLAADAVSIGHGGVSIVSRSSKVSRTTIHAAQRELFEEGAPDTPQQVVRPGRVRKPGGGRKRISETDKQLLLDLDRIVDPATRGDPMSPLRWTCKSTTKLAAELRKMGHHVSQPTVWRLLDELGYSMQSNRKVREGTEHPDRNAQFEFIASTVQSFVECGSPVISVDTKKKALIGAYKNAGREWQKKRTPLEVNMHDFPDPEKGKAIPYGVYDIGRNEGWVSVGVTHDTAEFAVQTIRQWWYRMGREVYPSAYELLITADCGGSNGPRVRLWKQQLQELADELGITIHVRHFPPGTSKWNKIEHRMFCHITENWRARPLLSRMTVVNLISHTHTDRGLSVQAELDERMYETGKKVNDKVMKGLRLSKCDFHGEWNYSLSPAPITED